MSAGNRPKAVVRQARWGAGVALLGALMAAACDRKAALPSWHQEGGYRWRELLAPSAGQEGFTRVENAGIRFQNTVSDSRSSGIVLSDREPV